MQKKTVLGIDAGRSTTKATAYYEEITDGRLIGKFVSIIFDSLVCPALDLADEATARRAELDTITLDGKRFFTGDTARLQGGVSAGVGLSDEWVQTIEYQVLIASAVKRFHAMGVPGLDDVYCVIGTPAKLYASQQAKFIEVTQKVVHGEIKVLPQPMGAYCAFVYTEQCTPDLSILRNPMGETKSWAVIEAGHFTTDFLLMLEGQYIERGAGSCGGCNIAAEHLGRILANKGHSANLVECTHAIRTKTIKEYGKYIDVSEYVEEAINHIATEVISKAESLFSSDARKLDGILLAGGTAEALYPYLSKKWGHCIMLKDPRMAVANGFCRFGVGVQIKRQTTNK